MASDEIRAATMQIVGRYQSLMAQGNWDEWIGLWAEGGILEFPFAPSGRKSLYKGHAEILAYMKAASGKIAIDSVERMCVHPMLDPGMGMVEVSIRGRAVATGAPYPQRYVMVFETENGKLKHYREYWNPLVSMDAFGEGWAATFGAGS